MVFLSAILGALALSALTTLYHWIFFRPALGDGQYAFVYFVTLPAGAILGALSGLLRRSSPKVARRVGVWGGGGLAALFLFLGLFVFCGTENPTLADRLVATLFWFALPLLWSGLLIRIGLRTLAKSGDS